jgi:hypothetical protein
VVGGQVDVQQQRAGVGVPAGHLAAGLEEHGQAAAVAARPGQGVADAVVEQRPVGQVGGAVVERLVPELGGEGVALAERGPEHALGAAELAHGALPAATRTSQPAVISR